MTYEVVYVNGPRHGEREVVPGDPFDAPKFRRFPTMTMPGNVRGEAVYAFLPEADTPGALAYVYVTSGEQP